MTSLAVRYGKRAETENGARTPSDVLLWTNPNTSTSRSSLDATLSQSLQNFSKIRVEYAYSTSSASADYYVVFPVFGKDGSYMFASGRSQQNMSLSFYPASGNRATRIFYVSSDTVIHFNNTTRIGTSGNLASNLIPWKIYGIKSGYGSSSSGGGSSIPVYTGDYDVIPDPDVMQTLQTSGKQMIDNVTVQKIPYYETSNPYGETVYIGVPEE